MVEKRHLDRLSARTLEVVILGESHGIRDLGLNSVYIEGDWLSCEKGNPVYFWIKSRNDDDTRMVVARGTVVRHDVGVGAAVTFEAEDSAWPTRFSMAVEIGDPTVLFC